MVNQVTMDVVQPAKRFHVGIDSATGDSIHAEWEEPDAHAIVTGKPDGGLPTVFAHIAHDELEAWCQAYLKLRGFGCAKTRVDDVATLIRS